MVSLLHRATITRDVGVESNLKTYFRLPFSPLQSGGYAFRAVEDKFINCFMHANNRTV